jgi:hypothetical protein
MIHHNKAFPLSPDGPTVLGLGFLGHTGLAHVAQQLSPFSEGILKEAG